MKKLLLYLLVLYSSVSFGQTKYNWLTQVHGSGFSTYSIASFNGSSTDTIKSATAGHFLKSISGSPGFNFTSIDTSDIALFYSKVRGLFSAGFGLSYSSGVYSADSTVLATPYDISQHNLAAVLASGNSTGGSNINVSAGDKIIVADADVSTIAAFSATKDLESLPTSIYPSLIELQWVKGVTSGIQPQLNLKLPIADTSSMLTNYVNAVNAPLTKSGHTVSLDTTSSTGVATQYDISAHRTYWVPINTLSGTVTSGATRYFGSILRTATATAGDSKIYFRQSGTITIADLIFFASGTAGSNENISIYVRLNNTTDYLVATVGSASAERIFTNTSINVPISIGDYVEMKIVTPSWGTPPTSVLMTGKLIFIAN